MYIPKKCPFAVFENISRLVSCVQLSDKHKITNINPKFKYKSLVGSFGRLKNYQQYFICHLAQSKTPQLDTFQVFKLLFTIVKSILFFFQILKRFY